MKEDQAPVLSEQLVRAILGFPKFFVSFLLGFVVIVLVEVDMTAVLLASVVLGFAVKSALWAIFFFLVAWVSLRALSALGLIGQSIRNLFEAVVYHANHTAQDHTAGQAQP
jgi:hypothetical protein